MAKKKSSAKKAVKKTVKKVVKKVAKKVSKKAPVKKATAKKSPAKKAASKPAKKAAPKKPAAKKAVAPKKSVKAPAKKAVAAKTVKPATSHLVSKPAVKKIVDLNDFVTPLDDRLIVQTSSSERMTAGGLYIPDTVADVSGNMHGTVVAVGRGHVTKKGHLRPMELKVGDKVVFSQYTGSKINLKNEDLVILRETEVLGLVEK